METLWAELRLAIRGFRRSPTFTIATVAILALGIGMATAMFTIYKTVLVDRFPVTAQDRIVIMHPLDRRGTHLDAPYSYLPEIARDSALFRGVAGIYHRGAQPLPFVEGSTTIELAVVGASPNYFAVFGMRPALGRLFRSEDGDAGAPPVIVLSYAAWRRRFGGDSSIIGRVLITPYDQKQAKIVGVAPAGFDYPSVTEAWLQIPHGDVAQVDVIARLAPHATPAVARAGVFALMQRVNPFASIPGQKKLPKGFEIAGVALQSFGDTVLGSSRPAIVALTFAVGLLLLIACVNVGNLVLVRLLGRTREIAVRRAIGASYADVVRLFAIETAVLAVAGGALGLLTALGLLHLVQAAAPPQLPRNDALGSLAAPLLVAGGITMLAMLLFGVAPSLTASRVTSYASLRSDSRTGTEGRSKRHARRWLVSTQVALALVMLAGAGLLVRTLARLQSMDLGYEPDHLSVISFSGPHSVFPTDTQAFDVAKRLVTRLEATPGVIAATPIESGPFQGQSFFIMKLWPVDEPVSEREHNPFTPWEFVGPNYFRTFDIPIRRGRGFAASDTKGSEKVVVVSQTLARQLWPNETPLGKQLQTLDTAVWTVVGVASDTHYRELKNVGPVVYFDWEQMQPFWSGTIALRTRSSLAVTLPSIRAATREVNPNLILWDAQTMDQLLDAPLAQPRLSALLLSGFSVVALLLSAIGLYGVMSSAVRHQTRDIGVRLALGATSRDVRRLVLGDALHVVGVGAVVGGVAAIVAGRVLESQLFEVRSTDPLSLAAAAVVLIAISLGAAYLPARRATRINPIEALRSE